MDGQRLLQVPLTFHSADVDPVGNEFDHDEYLLYNPCDGFHIAFASFDGGEFTGFQNFLGTQRYERDFYDAWAKLPDCVETLHPAFGRTREQRERCITAGAVARG